MMQLRKKHWILAAALAASILTGLQGTRTEKSATVVEPAARAHHGSAGAKPVAAGAIPLDKLNRPTMTADAINIFTSKSWYVPPPPPPPAKPAPPPPPSAPPLPFTYLGKLQEAPGQMVVFLVKGDRVYSVSQGDVIDGMYHVDGITGNSMALTYLPLKIKQSLGIGETS
jgi:hypothetical protein